MAAGRAGDFALVVGVNRAGQAEQLKQHGADVVVDDLAELRLTHDGVPLTPIADLPPGDDVEELRRRVRGRAPAVFLDYDGVLSPIVADPAAAVLSPQNKQALRALADRMPVYIVSGRDTDDVAGLIDLEGLTIAGSHGFDILHADGRREVRAEEFRKALSAAADRLDIRLGDTPGALVERKRFAIAVHYRNVAVDRQSEVVATARQVGDTADQLRVTGGKKIVELRPDFEWHKGKALEYLLERFGLDRDDVAPVYVDDDVTDEDAFRAIHHRGVGIVVKGEDDLRPTAAHLSLPDTDAVRWLPQDLCEVTL